MTDPTMYERAAQVRWVLHLASAATFTLAMTLLAARLRRPIMRTVAAVWWCQLAIALNMFAFWYWRSAFVSGGSAFAVSTVFLYVSHCVMAPLLAGVVRLVDEGEFVGAPAWRPLLGWAAAGAVLAGIDLGIEALFPGAADSFVAVYSRAIAALPYVWAVWPRRRDRRARPRDVQFAVRALYVACATRVLALTVDLGVRLTAWPADAIGTATAVVVTVNVVALIAFGTLMLFVALEHERALTLRQAQDLHAAQLRAARAGRLESLGRLAGGVAHDFNNVLAVIMAAVDVAKQEPAPTESMREELTAIGDAGQRGVALTRQLLDFARESPPAIADMSPADALRGLEPMCERLLGDGCRLELEVTAASAVHMDPSQFEQVVMNLVINARDAMPAGGVVTVTLADERLAASRTPANGALPAGAYVRLSVRDDGEGIPAELLPSIFEPFFTTKGGRGGTGLGLATVQRVARETGGDVSVESVPGRGTRFDVWLAVTGDGSRRT